MSISEHGKDSGQPESNGEQIKVAEYPSDHRFWSSVMGSLLCGLLLNIASQFAYIFLCLVTYPFCFMVVWRAYRRQGRIVPVNELIWIDSRVALSFMSMAMAMQPSGAFEAPPSVMFQVFIVVTLSGIADGFLVTQTPPGVVKRLVGWPWRGKQSRKSEKRDG